MALSKVAILSLRGMTRDQKVQMAIAAGATENTFYRWIQKNDENLTRAAVLKVIREETGLTDDELLERAIA